MHQDGGCATAVWRWSSPFVRFAGGGPEAISGRVMAGQGPVPRFLMQKMQGCVVQY